MGEVIRKTAAMSDILDDFGTAHSRALAKGGIPAKIAGERLSPLAGLIGTMLGEQKAAKDAAAPLVLQLDVANERADKAVGAAADAIWNAVGRPGPGSDAALSILFPGGNTFHVDGDVTEQPDKMDLLVQLLGAGLHPKLPAADAKQASDSIAAEAVVLRAAVEAARAPQAKALLMDRVIQAIARAAAIELANFKRVLKANHLSETEIHSIIPDRSSPAPKKPANDPAKPAPAPGNG